MLVRLYWQKCDRVWVLAEGQNLALGTPAEIQTNSQATSSFCRDVALQRLYT
ncbi:MAG: hypothetical protein H0U45_09680 [Tatlockia sp.]|nr:hypothetical protein [Tatlockia sp.]